MSQNKNIIIIGTDALAVSTYNVIKNRQNILGSLSFSGQHNTMPKTSVPNLGSFRQLQYILQQHPIRKVYIAGRVMIHGSEMQQVVKVCERFGIPFAVPAHSLNFTRATSKAATNLKDGYLHYTNHPEKPIQSVIKRAVDIILSAIALVALSPLLIITALAIKRSSKGPILFRQTRVGRNGVSFSMFKFRSMVNNAEALRADLEEKNEQTGAPFKMQNDPRVTSVGKIIRKHSVDELPQLLNILRGDMSIVGPRPALPDEVKKYKDWHRRRLSAAPGLTCYWQVSGRNRIKFDEWMRLDAEYVDNWSLAVDAKLILKTIPVVISGDGAS